MGIGPGYRRLWFANTTGNLGAGIYVTTLPMLAATLSTDPATVAGVAVAVELPWLLFALPSGAIVDRGDRRGLASTSTALGGILIAILAGTVAAGAASLPMVYVFAFSCGVCTTMASTATTALTPMLVPRDQLGKANSRMVAAGSTGAELAGPAVGGYLFGILAAVPLVVHAGLSAASAVLLALLPTSGAADSEDERQDSQHQESLRQDRRIIHDIATGTRWLLRHRVLRTITLLSVLFAIADSAWFALFALYVTQLLELPASAYGYIVGIGAVGGLGGGLLAPAITARFSSTGTLLALLLTAAAAAQLVLAGTTDAITATAMLSISSFAFGVLNVLTITLFQTRTPSHLLGRVTSAHRTAIMGASPLGALLGGGLANLLGLRAPLVLGVPILLIAAMIAVTTLSGTSADAEG